MPRICIVGAGIAGLRCAESLLNNGFEVTILEARDRIGGRMCQATLPSGIVLDLGPNWVHGAKDNPFVELAQRTNTALHSWQQQKEQNNIFNENGEILADGRFLSDRVWDILAEAFKYSEENTASIDPETSLYDYFVDRVKNVIPEGEGCEHRRKGILQMCELWGNYVGSSVQTQSLKFFWLEQCINGEHLFCAGTFKEILHVLAKPALAGAEIRLSTKVTTIQESGDKVEVITDAGSAFEFDEVVVTAPLGWLKRNKQTFVPPLPSKFALAIDSIGYGCLEKVFITFPSAFWLNPNTTPETQPFAGFTQWLAPSYAPETNPRRWYNECLELSTLPEPRAHPTLLFYIFGDQAITLSKQLNALESGEAKKEHLIKMYKPYYSLLPNYVEEKCVPVSCVATDWLSDELAGWGSYGTYRTGLLEGDSDIKIMRRGLPERHIWFAGEHIGPFIALGTISGAYWSGESVGKRIAAAYGLSSDDIESSSLRNDVQHIRETSASTVEEAKRV
ncbi:hypothetical protein B0O99DRAFT_389672 [Bisporella sp. PMI_857]|nr:hypothetical protein B0O99DRAFT_389672 [Bisporella sp. PMI_857]